MKRICSLLLMMLSDYIYLVLYYFGGKLTTKHHYDFDAPNVESRLPKEVLFNIKKHRIQILGDSYLNFCETKLLWNICPRTGYKWSNRWHRFVNKERPIKSDIKIPWELGRLQHLTTLMIYEKSEATEQFVLETIVDFHKNNRIGFGVNWACTMDVSIRVVNMVFIYLLTDNLKTKDFILSKLPYYYKFICKYDEWNDGSRNNHYLTNLMAKNVLAQLLFSITKDNVYEKDMHSHFKSFLSEVDFQFTDKGINFEGSINYHRLSSEIVLITYYFLKEFCFDLPLDNIYISKFKSMCDYIVSLYNDYGHTQIGDTDSGYIVNFSPKFRKLNDLIIQDFSKINHELFSLNIKSVCNISDLLRIMTGFYSSSALKCENIKCHKVDFKGEWIVPTFNKKFTIVTNDSNSGIIKIIIDDGYIVIKRPGSFNTGHSHLDYLKVEVFINGVFYSLFKGTDKYSKALNDRCFDRVGYYGHLLKYPFPCFYSLPDNLIKTDKLIIDDDYIRINVKDDYLEISQKNNELVLSSSVNPFMCPEVYYPSYQSPRDIDFL